MAVEPTADEMSVTHGVVANSRDVLLALNFARDGHIAILARLGGGREEMQRQRLQRLALLIVRFLVNIDVIEIPFAERFKHRLVFRALDELGHKKSVQ